MIPFDRLISAPTSTQVFEKLLSVLERVGIPARSWRVGGVGRSLLGVLAEVGAQGAAIVSSLAAGNFLAFATGDYLTAHAEDVYGVIRAPATSATGFVTLTNAGGAILNYNADELIVRAGETGPRFSISQAFSLGANTSITVAVRAVVVGSASSVAPGSVDRLETPVARVTVTNGASIVGRDAQSDEDLRAQCYAQRGTWSSLGPRDAYLAAVLGATLVDGSKTSINRVSVLPANGTASVTVVCATPSGTPTAAELTAAQTAIEAKARPDSVIATAVGASPKPTAKTIRIWARGGTESVLIANAQAALAKMIAAYPIGGIAKTDGGTSYLFDDFIEATVIAANPETFDVDIISGAGDVSLATNDVATNTTAFEVRIR